MSLNLNTLEAVAQAMTQPGKGILAADESTGTIGKRFDQINTECTFEIRNAYRDLLFNTDGMENYISGVIMYDETLHQSSLSESVPYPEFLAEKGVIPGIKVDMGVQNLPGSESEKITHGLDGLDDRLKEYRKLGARFAKWRAVINITDNNPSGYCIGTNAHTLARYASLCQSNDIVPIVEPEILMDGTHDIDDSFVVTEEVLHTVFFELYSQGVEYEQMVLKPNMVLSGYNASDRAGVDEVADATLQCFFRTVPAAVPGIAFLSGGQSDEDATAHLNQMNRVLGENKPWNLSFSYGRALQQPALKAWQGQIENVSAAQEAFLKRAKLNSLASKGEYSKDME
ncbi:MAG: fructose-bisphosphate aldolase class I [Candidatus Marinimicrobia bacterium]|jgi:fructose-bisphosphate aldolase class I|nr:fructose-bisphosphate aldolase class I [Candidatus Neomarinimicrobiota bacterium]|tara:strand:+ start:1775 stop:2800 length:1026 start_codon:yes stop_codon:yes gene_type:complete